MPRFPCHLLPQLPPRSPVHPPTLPPQVTSSIATPFTPPSTPPPQGHLLHRHPRLARRGHPPLACRRERAHLSGRQDPPGAIRAGGRAPLVLPGQGGGARRLYTQAGGAAVGARAGEARRVARGRRGGRVKGHRLRPPELLRRTMRCRQHHARRPEFVLVRPGAEFWFWSAQGQSVVFAVGGVLFSVRQWGQVFLGLLRAGQSRICADRRVTRP